MEYLRRFYPTGRAWCVPTLVILLMVTAFAGCSREPTGPRPNVIVVLLDTVRRDALGNGPHGADTPFLDEIRAAGVDFKRARSTSSWTAPATASLFTALYPNEHGVIQGFLAHKQTVETLESHGDAALQLNALPEDIATLPERMKAGGYRTFGLAANLNIGSEMGFSRGFDRFMLIDDAPADVMVDSVAAWLPALAADPAPYFLYVHLNDAHLPYVEHAPWYEPAPGDKVADNRSRYLSEIGFLDTQLARMAEMIDVRHQGLLVIVSDHGEEFREHGRIGHPPSLYSEVNDVICLVHGPALGVIPAARSELVNLADVMPTVLDMVWLPAAEPASGLSLARLCRDGSGAAKLSRTLERRTLFAHRLQSMLHGRHVWSAMRGPWKLIQDEHGRQHVFNLEHDPREKHSLTRANDPIGDGLPPALADFQRRPTAGHAAEVSVPLDQALAERLKSLGYVR